MRPFNIATPAATTLALAGLLSRNFTYAASTPGDHAGPPNEDVAPPNYDPGENSMISAIAGKIIDLNSGRWMSGRGTIEFKGKPKGDTRGDTPSHRSNNRGGNRSHKGRVKRKMRAGGASLQQHDFPSPDERFQPDPDRRQGLSEINTATCPCAPARMLAEHITIPDVGYAPPSVTLN